ncbi:hypothetical protein ACIBHX_23460 [Nonomuraea sp. NPDC050536]|uniref:hypothetical protein n=1 Tax=Nonomuraea sp. NPDC050536 TaxID=3364366 RepID=UPI0037C72FA9
MARAGPRVFDGSKLSGQTSDLTKVQINGTEYTPAVTTTPGTDWVDYAMRVTELDMTPSTQTRPGVCSITARMYCRCPLRVTASMKCQVRA